MTKFQEIIKRGTHPALIAGPCAAESRKQLLDTAMALKDIPGIIAFRAGIWKARSMPGDFAGAGKQGLAWLKEVKDKSGLKLAVEIASPEHAEQCLEAGIDILWIGARTMVNPFMVEEIAASLRDCNICVMIKNPLNPDRRLWAGGIERLQKAGLENLAAVHRGFDAWLSHPYRNLPIWEIPMELKRQFPELPILCDPSHIGGKRELLQAISQKALDLGFDGLMIESHIDPGKALSDAPQQIAPAELKSMLSRLIVKKQQGKSKNTRLEEYRTAIDEIDGQLLELLAKRLDIASKIGKLKKSLNMTPYQPERWESLLNERLDHASSLKIDPEFVKKIFEHLHMESIRRQGPHRSGDL